MPHTSSPIGLSSRHQRRYCLSLVLAAAMAAGLGCRDDATAPTDSEPAPDLAAASSAPLVFRQVSAGVSHSCGVTSDDRAYCWGDNAYGQLGDGTSGTDVHRTRPVAVVTTLRFRSVSAGGFYTCALATDDRAYCWGQNAVGNLGDGTTTRRLKPVAVAGERRFRQLSAGGGHVCAVNPLDRLFCWGLNSSGQLGDGTRNRRLTPIRVPGTLLFRQVSASDNYTCAVTTTDRAYCWGANQDGQLGDRTKEQRLNPVAVVGGLSFREVAALYKHTCGVTTGDKAYCWGFNGLGQLGEGNQDFWRRLRPVPVTGGHSFRSIDVGYSHSCGLTSANAVYCWGSNHEGELGDGTNDTPKPAPVAVAGGLHFTKLDTGAAHTCGVATDNRAYCWGDNFFGKLGDGSTVDQNKPTPVAGS